MPSRLLVASVRLVCLVSLCPLFLASAQNTPPAAAQQSSKADDAWFAHVRSLYTSTERDGLRSFDCEIHPDWRTLAASANNGVVDADGERRIAALSTVRITMHAHMDGTAAIDWVQNDPPADLADMMNSVHQGTKQTLEGFVQFWAPFADISVIPSNSRGIDITRTADGGRVLRSSDNGTKVTATFDSGDILREYDVETADSAVQFAPTFAATPRGLRVVSFLAHIRPNGSAQPQEMHVNIIYSEVGGFAIPSELDMTVVGTGAFNFTLDGCRVNP